MKRRSFIKNASLTGIGLAVTTNLTHCTKKNVEDKNIPIASSKMALPMVIATWNVPNATTKAWDVLQSGKSALDAVEQGCMIEEADVTNSSVGKAGLPDRDGNVTLDACIMNKHGDCGSVVYLQNITHAVSVA